jgi:transcriptional regulator of acetoin/glycerol metabolism
MNNQVERSEREQLAESLGVAAIPARVTASWRRSAGYGVALDAVTPAFVGGIDDESLFYECGQSVLRGLHETLADEPVSLMLTNADGLVLSRLCGERGLVRALDDVFLAPGFGYSERETGTTGLGLAIADRAPTLVSAQQHYCTRLWAYTCAAVPVTDPVSGELVGSVNLTTWAQRSHNLLLALAQTAAGNTAALMLAHHHGRAPRPMARGEVFRVNVARFGHDDSLPEMSAGWRGALAEAEAALADGRSVCVVGEPGAGKTALLASADTAVRPRDRVIAVRPPEPQDVKSWLSLWAPELRKENTTVIIGRVDALPSWAAAEVAGILTAAGHNGRGAGRRLAVTAPGLSQVPAPLRELLDMYVEVPALRHRLDDVMPLAGYFGRKKRGREIGFTPAATHVLTAYQWPGNVTQLRQVVDAAVSRADVVDARHLAPEVFSGPGHRLSQMETMERDAIIRCLAEPGATAADAAARLGISRATIYRRIARYGIRNWDRAAG